MILIEIALGLGVLFLIVAACIKLADKWKLIDSLKAWIDKFGPPKSP